MSDQRPSGWRPGKREASASREAALEVLRRIDTDDAFANLLLPKVLRYRRITGRDAAFATELTYGCVRMRARYDALIAHFLTDRTISELEPMVLDVLRLGAHQLLAMRVPEHAAVTESVNQVRTHGGSGAAGLTNAILRRISELDETSARQIVFAQVDPEGTNEIARLAAWWSHPQWIVRALEDALRAHGRPLTELEPLLAAQCATPRTTLVARPGLIDRERLINQRDAARAAARRPRHTDRDNTHDDAARPTPAPDEDPEAGEAEHISPLAVYSLGDPSRITAVNRGQAGVQDEASQLVTLAFSRVPIDGPDSQWLDMCAGPGGKAALLGAIAAQRGARLLANELHHHRAELTYEAVHAVNRAARGTVTVEAGDARELGELHPATFDRVLLDAPCSGLGALRRRPESRWRHQPSDIAELTALQKELLTAAWQTVRSGGLIGYVTCSPHKAETLDIIDWATTHGPVEVVDVAPALARASMGASGGPVHVGGPTACLWPHTHNADAMFLAVLRRLER